MIKSAIATRPFVLLTFVTLFLAGCNTALNPANWFGNSREVEVTDEGTVNPLVPQDRSDLFRRPDFLYPGIPVETVTDIRIERTRSGAIILVEGVAARQGPYEVQLTPANQGNEPVDGVLTYSLDIIYPEADTVIGPEATRRVTAARSISSDVLQQTRIVRVTGAQNAREVRRR